MQYNANSFVSVDFKNINDHSRWIKFHTDSVYIFVYIRIFIFLYNYLFYIIAMRARSLLSEVSYADLITKTQRLGIDHRT